MKNDAGGGAQFVFGCHFADPVVSIPGRPKEVTPFRRRQIETENETKEDIV